MVSFREVFSFILWRTKLPRYLSKSSCKLKTFLFKKNVPPQPYSTNGYLDSVNTLGYCKIIEELDIPAIDLADFDGAAKGKAFVDIGDRLPLVKENLFVSLMGVPGVQDLVNGYFDGLPRLWNVALNYSDPSDNSSDNPSDSQLWHFDYGDVKQLHLLVYLSDVDEASGPFSFIDKKKSLVAERSSWIVERWNDDQLEKLGVDLSTSVNRLIGLKGDVYAADPGVMLHQGARCQRPRLVMFVTFTTQCPLSKAPRHTITPAERKRLENAYFSSSIEHKLAKLVFVQ